MRRTAATLLPLLLLTGLAGALPGTAAAASSSSELQPRDLTITVTGLGSEKRSCRIDADLYVPLGVDAAHRAPAVLTTNGFGGTKTDQAELARGLADAGYVTLAYTGLGFVDGNSCPITLDDVDHDGAAASQLIRFLGGDPAVRAVDDSTGATVVVDQVTRQDARTHVRYDPAVGMMGGSYGGQVQFAAAAAEHRAGTDRLDAIVPAITWHDLAYSLAPENSALPAGTSLSGSVRSAGTGVFKYQWAALFTSLGVATGAQDATSVDPTALTDPAEAQQYLTDNCVNFEPQVCRALLEVGTLGYPSAASIAYLRSNSVGSYLSDLRVPTLLLQGQADTLFNLQESAATATALLRQRTPVSLVWQSWGHSDSTPVPGEYDERHLATSYEGRQVLGWLDAYVRGSAPKPAASFSWFRDWVYASTGDAAKSYATTSLTRTSLAKLSTRTLHLSGSSDLVASKKAVRPGTGSYSSVAPVGPNYTETSAIDQSAPVTDPPGTAARFSTAPLSSALDVVGSPRLTVTLEAPSVRATQMTGPGGQLVLYAKLYDVGPDGAVELPHRLIAPVRVTDASKPVTVELPAIVHRFPAGHRLAVVLAGGDDAYRGATLPQPVTVRTGQLTLPVTS